MHVSTVRVLALAYSSEASAVTSEAGGGRWPIRRMEIDDSMLRCLAGLRSLSAAAALAAGTFLIDTLTSPHFAVASLYVIVVSISAHDLHRRDIVTPGVALLTVLSYALMHGFEADGAAPLRFAVSLISILIDTILVLRNVSANLRVKEVERQRGNLARFFSPKIVDQLVDIRTPFSSARRQPATVPLPK